MNNSTATKMKKQTNDTSQISEEQIERLVEERLLSLMKEDAAKLIMYFLVIMGREAVSANAETITLKQESDIEDKRYAITAKISVKQIKNLTTKKEATT